MVEVLRCAAAVRAWRSKLPADVRVGFVPTMGYLHDGHLSLLNLARERVGTHGRVVLSIFVNPTQFAPGEDLERYPRDEAGDLAKASASGVDMAYVPDDPGDIYPFGEGTWVTVPALSSTLCGVARPTHFRGVATVVTKLWGIVRPDVAVFGEKDYQQLAVIRRVHADLFLPGEVLGGPIVREPDGLAMSSRNAYLDPQQRREALAIRRFLQTVQRRFAAGERDRAALLEGHVRALAPGRIDYVSLVDAEQLGDVQRVERTAVCAVAVAFGRARLLDNVVLKP